MKALERGSGRAVGRVTRREDPWSGDRGVHVSEHGSARGIGVAQPCQGTTKPGPCYLAVGVASGAVAPAPRQHTTEDGGGFDGKSSRSGGGMVGGVGLDLAFVHHFPVALSG